MFNLSKFALIVLLAVLPTVAAVSTSTSLSTRVPTSTSITTGLRLPRHHRRHSLHPYYQSTEQIESIEQEEDDQQQQQQSIERIHQLQFETLRMELLLLKELVNNEIISEDEPFQQTNNAQTNKSKSKKNSKSFIRHHNNMIGDASIQNANQYDMNEMANFQCDDQAKLDFCLVTAGVPNALLCALTGAETAGVACLANLIAFGAAAATCVYSNCQF